MLENEFKYYLDNQTKLIEKYDGQYIVIKSNKVIGNYSNIEAAYSETEKKHLPGTFLIQYCEPGDKSYTQIFHSRVTFR